MQNISPRKLKEQLEHSHKLVLALVVDKSVVREVGFVELINVCQKYAYLVHTCIVFEWRSDFLEQGLGIMGTPTYVMYRNGQEVGRLIGEIDVDDMNSFIVSCINSACKNDDTTH